MANGDEFIGMESYLPAETAKQMRENFDEIPYEINGIKYHKRVSIYNKPVENSDKNNSKNKK